jgi:2-methyl-3-hydroxypyridine 5-carboxylic acid dioxygenase
MARPRHVEIAGAGFAGLTAAIALKSRGWSVRVHEASETLRAFGAGIFIWENGLRVLKAIGAYDEVMRGSHLAEYFETRIAGRTVTKHKFGADSPVRMVTMTRQHLYSAILNAAQRADVEIVTGSEATGASPEGELHLVDGTSHKADLVIGADGVKSAVRASLNLPTQREVFKDGVIRLLGPRVTERSVAGDWNWNDVIDFWGGENANGLRILYVPCNETEAYLCMMAPSDQVTASRIPIEKNIWCDAIPELTPILEKLEDQGRYDPYELTKLEKWSSGRVALVGDSAHGMPPTLGQGAGCAMMNALGLAVAMDERADIEDALELWEKRERPLTDYTQQTACFLAATRNLAEGDTFEVSSDRLRTARHIPTGTEQTA